MHVHGWQISLRRFVCMDLQTCSHARIYIHAMHPASCMQCCLTAYACPRPPARTNHAPALRALSTTCQALNARKDRAHFEDLVSDLTGSLSHAQSKLEDARVEMQMAEKRHEELLVKQVSRPPSLDSPCLLPPPTPSYPHDPWSTLHHLL